VANSPEERRLPQHPAATRVWLRWLGYATALICCYQRLSVLACPHERGPGPDTATRSAPQFIARKHQYHMFPVTVAAFVGALQKAADWLTVRKVPPESETVADHLAAKV
jgi:hypothetical protein